MDIRDAVDRIYRAESRRVLATLIRLLGDFDLAEEAMHDAFTAAVEQWPRDGVPANPRAWLVSTGRFKGVDTLRRRARFDASLKVGPRVYKRCLELGMITRALPMTDTIAFSPPFVVTEAELD